MGRTDRLQLLFQNDHGLLKMDSQLNVMSVAEPPISDAAVSAPVPARWLGPVGPSMLRVQYRYPLSYIRTHLVGVDAELRDNQRIQPEQAEVHLPTPEQEKRASPPPENNRLESATQAPISPSDASLASSFCPAMALARFLYKYVRGGPSQNIASQFFDAGKFWDRNWDLYYMRVPLKTSNRPLLLVPAIQAKALLEEINQALHCTLSLTARTQEGLVLPFDEDGTPLPVFLGRSSSRREKEQIEMNIPLPPADWGPWVQGCDPQILRAFQEKIEAGVEATKSKSRGKAGKIKRQQKRSDNERKWAQGLLRAQSYFGLRPPYQGKSEDATSASGSFPVNVLFPAQWAFQDAPIFVSVDVEWNERNPSQVTEVGISTLDTLDLTGLPPGDYGGNWVKQIQSRHLRVLEYRHVINREFCDGCPDLFGFGESEFVPEDALGLMVDQSFISPYDAGLNPGRVLEHKQKARTVVLVGHNLTQDLKCLRDVGSQVFANLATAASVVREQFDTAELYRSLRCEESLRSLCHVMGGLNILAVSLHNAGNDARYAMEGLIRMALEAAGEKPGACESVTYPQLEETTVGGA